LPLLLISTHPSIEQAVEAIKLGASDYLPANASDDHLCLIVYGLLKYGAFRVKRHLGEQDLLEATRQPIAVEPQMRKIFQLAKKVAPKRATVLLQGESGTGKEVVARYIHSNSDRRQGPFIALNCAALPESLLESELFGHERGAFTGALTQKKGKFELANQGTILLDEVSEMPLSLQAKLLRVLQEKEIDRVGGQFAMSVDVRVLATTNRNLENEIQEGKFRADLYYRLNVIPLHLPPLRERREDILPLAKFFLQKHARINDERPRVLSREAEEFLMMQSWPGNVRELENLMERATLLVESDTIRKEDLADISNPSGPGSCGEGAGSFSTMPLKDMERKMILRALENHDGNRTHAAKVLGISVRTLRNKLHEYREEYQGD
jgi:DNA-binding NtrC family response regulator